MSPSTVSRTVAPASSHPHRHPQPGPTSDVAGTHAQFSRQQVEGWNICGLSPQVPTSVPLRADARRKEVGGRAGRRSRAEPLGSGGDKRAGRSPGGSGPACAPPRGPVIDRRRDRRQVPATSGRGVSWSETPGGPGSLSPPFLSHPHCLSRPRAGDPKVGPRLGAGDRVRPRAARPGTRASPSTSPSQPARVPLRRVPGLPPPPTPSRSLERPPAPHPLQAVLRSAWPGAFSQGPFGRERGAAARSSDPDKGARSRARVIQTQRSDQVRTPCYIRVSVSCKCPCASGVQSSRSIWEPVA
ncbi:unnamed protein product [Rangifer tarandus platyrhynchus]|uniref:Uncharacterized protein n=1 Tax=Rangifer tarandus platyrhynchus TaxID=3082113 RepID=A0ACB1MK16_RANTA